MLGYIGAQVKFPVYTQIIRDVAFSKNNSKVRNTYCDGSFLYCLK